MMYPHSLTTDTVLQAEYLVSVPTTTVDFEVSV